MLFSLKFLRYNDDINLKLARHCTILTMEGIVFYFIKKGRDTI